MSTPCCRCAFGPGIEAQLRNIISRIDHFYPTTKICCIWSKDGELIVEHSTAFVKREELQNIVSQLRQAALRFGQALGQMECPIIHIKGHSHLFSCFDINQGDHFLAFYTEMDGPALETLDTIGQDQAMLGAIGDELSLALRNLKPLKRRKNRG
eukprot:gnl/Trimastix_PCT/2227.p1 GENE.gnl/Trimastix_PCT/2227~~gnl/Trimastix_PCT/2227.p1  ORF type:complete len:154 (+),score=13.72 gnl/Trimastix_PCT/2227:64-525(+)